MTDHPLGVNPDISDWLIKVMFLKEAERVIKSGIKLGVVPRALAQVMPF